MFYKQQECNGQHQNACSDIPILTISQDQFLDGMPVFKVDQVALGTKRVRVGSIAGIVPIYSEEPCGPYVKGRIHWTPAIYKISRSDFNIDLGTHFTLAVHGSSLQYICMLTGLDIGENHEALIVTSQVEHAS